MPDFDDMVMKFMRVSPDVRHMIARMMTAGWSNRSIALFFWFHGSRSNDVEEAQR